MKKFLRKRGADTNQNIFYLVIAVIVLAAAAFGFDQALKSMNRADARNVAAAVSNQTRALFANQGDLPATLTAATVVNADVLPGNATDGTDIILPNGGTVTSLEPNATIARDFDVNYSWGATPTPRGEGICNALIAGATNGDVVESGPLGMDYTVTAADCDAAAGIDVTYHR